MASLADMRARIAAQENKSNTKSSATQSDNSIYPHWNMDEGTTASIRSCLTVIQRMNSSG